MNEIARRIVLECLDDAAISRRRDATEARYHCDAAKAAQFDEAASTLEKIADAIRDGRANDGGAVKRSIHVKLTPDECAAVVLHQCNDPMAHVFAPHLARAAEKIAEAAKCVLMEGLFFEAAS
jgi:hypothetical protein